ncbi:MAG: hypothetical protein WBC91_00350 [Phototrophicaceae bacterium]
MPVSLNWYGRSQRMVQARFIGQWDVSDFITTYENTAALMQQVSHPVHVIYDFKESTATPRDLLAGFQFANRILPSNQGVVVYVSANAVIKAFVLMAKRMGLPAVEHIYNVDTQEDAYRIIIEKAHRVQNV